MPGTTMSSVALIASHGTPSGTGVEPSRRKSGATFPQRPDNRPETVQDGARRDLSERCAEGDNRVDLSGEPTACDGLRDDNPAEAVFDQMHLIGRRFANNMR